MLHVYLCAFLNKVYLDEAKICITSLRENGRYTGPIYLFTDMDASIEGVTVIKAKCDSIYLSASYRTRLFEHFNQFSSDDIFLYIDTDIIILKPIPSFDHIDNKIHVYGYPNRKQNEASFAGFITDDKYFTTQTAICSGILLFRPSNSVKTIFDETYHLYLELINKNKINSCWEQPALCYILIKHNMYTISLNDYVYEERTKGLIKNTHIFNHFCGMRGAVRQTIMKRYLTHK